MSTTGATSPDQIRWLLEDFVSRADGLSDAVALSSDGLVLAAVSRLATESAARFGAITSGLSHLAQSAASLLDTGEILQTVVEMDAGYLLVTPIDQRACLAVVAGRGADLEQIGYEVTVLVERVGKVLTPAHRSAAAR
ncbi:MAG: roadblock/LC7 domain-containing protein [Actinobacteria bacterium]|nr:roadblock/LC7 domain-containing protein [Actinomycetota bacterium]